MADKNMLKMLYPNRRIYKKRAKQARGILIEQYGFDPACFSTTASSNGLFDDDFGKEAFGLHVSPHPLKGTPYLPNSAFVDSNAQYTCCIVTLCEIELRDDISPKVLCGRY